MTADIMWGGTVEKSTDGGTNWDPVPGVITPPSPSNEIDWKDATSLDSQNRYRDWVKGIKDVGEMTMGQLYSPDAFEAAVADEASDALIQYRVTLPTYGDQTSGDTFTFSAYPIVSPEFEDIAELVKMNTTLKASGGYTYAKGTNV